MKKEKFQQQITIKNSFAIIQKSKDVFSPLKEAISNSFDAITQRQKTGVTFEPIISVSVHFKTSKNMFGDETHSFDFISIEDNGIGFTKNNLSRFKNLADNSRGLNNQGTGKIQMFYMFNKISIDSIYYEDGKWNKLYASLDIMGNYEENLETVTNQAPAKTIIKMSEFSGNDKEHDFFMRYLKDTYELNRDILRHFFLRLWIGADRDKIILNLKVFLEANETGKYTFDQSNIPQPDKTETIEINTEQPIFHWNEKNEIKKIEWIAVEPKHTLILNRFEFSDVDLDTNAIFMCTKIYSSNHLRFLPLRKKQVSMVIVI